MVFKHSAGEGAALLTVTEHHRVNDGSLITGERSSRHVFVLQWHIFYLTPVGRWDLPRRVFGNRHQHRPRSNDNGRVSTGKPRRRPSTLMVLCGPLKRGEFSCLRNYEPWPLLTRRNKHTKGDFSWKSENTTLQHDMKIPVSVSCTFMFVWFFFMSLSHGCTQTRWYVSGIFSVNSPNDMLEVASCARFGQIMVAWLQTWLMLLCSIHVTGTDAVYTELIRRTRGDVTFCVWRSVFVDFKV